MIAGLVPSPRQRGEGTALEVREGDQVLATVARDFPATILAEHPFTTGLMRSQDPNITPPKLISHVEPVYPAEAKAKGIAGIVILETAIDETGAVGDVRILKPLPFGLDKAAADAVRQWRWEPATLDGKPVPAVLNVTISFRLE